MFERFDLGRVPKQAAPPGPRQRGKQADERPGLGYCCALVTFRPTALYIDREGRRRRHTPCGIWPVAMSTQVACALCGEPVGSNELMWVERQDGRLVATLLAAADGFAA